MLQKTPKAEVKIAATRRTSSIDVEVGRRIREARAEKGISQERLADATGVSFQQIQKYEKGTNRCAPARLISIAAFLEKEIAWFLPDAGGNVASPRTSAIDALAATRQGQRLAAAFMAIADEDLRASLVVVVETAAKAARGIVREIA